MPTKTNKSPLNLGPGILGIASGVVGGAREVLKDRKAAKEAGEKYGLLEGLKDFGLGALSGVTGGLVDFTGRDDKNQNETTYIQTNINPYTGKEYKAYGMTPFSMTGKPKIMKTLTQMQGTTAHNMSAKQHNDALKMKEISGSSSLPVKGVVEDWEEGLGKARFGDDYDPEKADIA